jgi:hypothetical protein
MALDAVAGLRDGHCLSTQDAAVVEQFVVESKGACFTSRSAPGHGDLHADHVFVAEDKGGKWLCNAIDFESTGVLREELDLVSPLLYVLDGCLPGRRLAVMNECFTAHPGVRAFEAGYRGSGGGEICWLTVACHGVCWCLEVAAACWKGSSRQGREGGETAAQMAVTWARQAHGW